MSSASSLETASLSALGAPSTTALASFNPKPVISRTTLITLTFCPPTSVNSTSNSVFSSAASPAPAPAATTTPAAADTPNSSSQAFTKSISIYLRYLISENDFPLIKLTFFCLNLI